MILAAREAAETRRSYEVARKWHFELPVEELRCLERCAAQGMLPVRIVPDDADEICDFVAERMLSDLQDPAYRRIKGRAGAREKAVILAKRLSDALELRFSVSAVGQWSFSKFSKTYIGLKREVYFSPNMMDIGLGLHIRGPGSRRFSNVPDVEIPFWFLAARSRGARYRTAAHISAAIGSWCALYRMIATEVERACRSCGAPISRIGMNDGLS